MKFDWANIFDSCHDDVNAQRDTFNKNCEEAIAVNFYSPVFIILNWQFLSNNTRTKLSLSEGVHAALQVVPSCHKGFHARQFQMVIVSVNKLIPGQIIGRMMTYL